MCEIRWLGHASWEITTGDGKRIYLDPWLDANPACPIKLSEIDRADIVCVSHGHRDHIGDSLDIVKKTGARLICTPEIGFYAASKGIEFDRGSYPLNIGGSVRLGGVTVHMTAAAHTTELYGEEWLKESRVLPGSGAVGFVLEEAGVSIYYAGDTGLFGDMRLIGELYNPQVALLPIGGKYNLGPRLAAFAA
ncbi:MAG: metal-dependent hydrolase, partial [Nitrospinota bacterium]